MDRLLTCHPIEGLQGVKKPRPATYWPVDALALAERLLLAGHHASGRSKLLETTDDPDGREWSEYTRKFRRLE
jgi:hypothetical protein